MSMPLFWLRRVFLKERIEGEEQLILPVDAQIYAWRKANRKMEWGIRMEEFERIEAPPLLTETDHEQGFIGLVLCYGFGDDGAGNADAVLSGKVAWEYALKRQKGKTWHCEYIDFEKSDHIRLRPGAPARPKGFYYVKFQPGEKSKPLTVSQFRKGLSKDTGCGPEGIQLLTITHLHFQAMMNERKMSFMAFADYDVAPYGFNDFFDAVQMFCSNSTLGLGIGNIDQNYPLFGIPFIRLQEKPEALELHS